MEEIDLRFMEQCFLFENKIKEFSTIKELAEDWRKAHKTIEELRRKLTVKGQEVDLLKDRVSDLTKTVKRPRFKKRSNESSSRGKICEDAEERNSKKGLDRETHKKDLKIHQTKVIEPGNIPEGAKFKCYKRFIVQDLIIEPNNIEYKRAVYKLKNGKLLIPDFPKGIEGSHFGINLRSYIQYQYHKMRTTEGVIYESLKDMGFDISKTQIHNIIVSESLLMEKEYKDILSSGLVYSSHICADDTGAKHKNKNIYCTQIGNEAFGWYKSTDRKTRINFLELLNNNKEEYAFTENSINYLKDHNVYEVKYIKRGLKLEGKDKLEKYIENLGMVSIKNTQLIKEVGLMGSIESKGISPSLFIMSDEAGQFNVFNRILCWVHIERNFKKLSPTLDDFKQDLELVLDKIWKIYKMLKIYKIHQSIKLKKEIYKFFDLLISTETNYVPLKEQLQKLEKNKNKLLPVLTNFNLPLHNNLSENNIRQMVMRRNISGSTYNEHGKNVRDIMTSIKVTCRRSLISFWDFLLDRISKQNNIPSLYFVVKNRLSELAITNTF